MNFQPNTHRENRERVRKIDFHLPSVSVQLITHTLRKHWHILLMATISIQFGNQCIEYEMCVFCVCVCLERTEPPFGWSAGKRKIYRKITSSTNPKWNGLWFVCIYNAIWHDRLACPIRRQYKRRGQICICVCMCMLVCLVVGSNFRIVSLWEKKLGKAWFSSILYFSHSISPNRMTLKAIDVI